MKNTVFVIDGGAGRAICSARALERYVNERSEYENITILMYGWDNLFWSNTKLQDITYNINEKGVYPFILKTADQVIKPEPYILPEYFRQEISLSEAFDYLINGSIKEDIDKPSINLSESEILRSKKTMYQLKNDTGKKKTIVFQPFGREAHFEKIGNDAYVIDPSRRSMNLPMYSMVIKELSKKHNVILFADDQFHFPEDNFSIKMKGDLRMWMSLIHECDYFVGVDSVGQHIARGFDKPGMVIFGSTFPENVSYPDWFEIIDRDTDNREYSPIRLNDIGCEIANRYNNSCMEYDENESMNIVKKINEKMTDAKE